MFAYASRNVPFYREHLQKNGLSVDDITGAGDLALLPAIDRNTVRKDPERFKSTGRQGKGAVEFRTAGTTGEPVTIWHDRKSLLLQVAYGARERTVISELLGGGLGYKVLHVDNPEGFLPRIFSFYRDSALTPFEPKRHFLPLSSPVQDVVQELEEFRPDLLISYGSYIEHLARLSADGGLDVKWPRLVRFGGDGLSPGVRQLLKDRFGVRTISNYCALECLKIGFECGKGSGFHLHEDLCHVRIMNADGTEASPGQKGEVEISNLVNRGTVLLNYRLGDVAAITSERCSCGRTGLRLTELEGRVEDIIVLSNSRFVHPRAVWALFRHDPLIQYQLVQHTCADFELKLVTGEKGIFERIRPEILRKLRELLGSDVKIVCTYVESPIRPATGKFRSVVAFRKRSNSGPM
jgi:phenylacetate-CoA ligase